MSFYTQRWAAIVNNRYKSLVVGVDSRSNGCPFLYTGYAWQQPYLNRPKKGRTMPMASGIHNISSLEIENCKCIICDSTIDPLHATAGSLQPDGSQTFACTAHCRNRRQWIVAWASFDALHGNTENLQTRRKP